jgi:hypothetical protein
VLNTTPCLTTACHFKGVICISKLPLANTGPQATINHNKKPGEAGFWSTVFRLSNALNHSEFTEVARTKFISLEVSKFLLIY